MVHLWLTSWLSVVLLSVTNAKVGIPCKSSEQCDVGECCAFQYSFVVSKRAVAKGLGWGDLFNGKICQAYLTEGQTCDTFSIKCGCAKGLQCLKKDSADLVQGKRVVAGHYTPRACKKV